MLCWTKPSRKAEGSDLPQIMAILASSLASLSNGLIFSWTSPAIPELVADLRNEISLENASYFTVISPIAMILFAPMVYFILEAVGRKTGVLLVAAPQILFWVFVFLANDIWMFYISRVMGGIGDAMFYGMVPVYVCEIAQPKVRGIWGNAVSICVYMGIFLINVIGAYYTIRETAIICGIITILHVVLFWFMPESPYYLLKKGKEEEARSCLRTLRWKRDVEEELSSLKADVNRQISETGTLRDLLKIESNRKALLLCIMIRVAQQFTGLPAFEIYTQYMFQQAGGSISEKTSSIIFSGILFVCVASSAYIVELVGRRPLMIYSCVGCGIMLATITSYFLVNQFSNLNLSKVTWIPLVCMSGYIVICSPGLGILPTLLLGELFSASIKAKAVSVMNIVLAICVLTVPKLFQSLTYKFGISVPFLLFTINCVIFSVLSYLYMIETKGKTLEEIQQELKGDVKRKVVGAL